MDSIYIEGETFERVDYTLQPLPKGEYENCSFIGCNFSDSDLTSFVFTQCNFDDCNISMAKVAKTAFREVVFRNCKLLGLRFDTCNGFLFSAVFKGCILNLSICYGLKLKKTIFKDCVLYEVDFTEADLSEAIFDNCDLTRAIFDASVLEGADFRTSFNYTINPQANKMKKAKFSASGINGLLYMHDIVIE